MIYSVEIGSHKVGSNPASFCAEQVVCEHQVTSIRVYVVALTSVEGRRAWYGILTNVRTCAL